MCCHLPESFYASYYKESYLRNHHEYEYADSLVGKEIFAESAAGLGRGLRGLRGPVAGAASRAWGFSSSAPRGGGRGRRIDFSESYWLRRAPPPRGRAFFMGRGFPAS